MTAQSGHAGRVPLSSVLTIAAMSVAAWLLLVPAGAKGATGLVPTIAGIVGLPVPAGGQPPVAAVGATGSAAVAAGNPGVVVAVCHVGVGARLLGLQIGVRADRLVAYLAAHPRDYAGACRSGGGLLPAPAVVGSDLLDTLPEGTLVRVVTAAGAVLWLSPADALAYLSIHVGARIGSDDNPPGGPPGTGSPAGGGTGNGGGANGSASGGTTSIAAGGPRCGDRLIVSSVRIAPRVLRTVGSTVTVDLVVSSEQGNRVGNAIVLLRSTPLGRIAATAVKRTTAAGTVRFTVKTTPQLRLVKGGRLVLFVRASRPGLPTIGCVTGRRLLSIRTAAA